MSGPKRKVPLPTPERVHSLVRYDGQQFHWLPRPRTYFKREGDWKGWNTRHANKPVIIKKMLNGYHGIRIDGALILIHRAIWVLHYGEWPKGELDHINGDKADNRIENLRDCTKSENMRNQKLRSDSTSGFPGVHFDKERGQWAARIGLNGGWTHLGRFNRKADAIAARKAAESEYGFSELHGRAA